MQHYEKCFDNLHHSAVFIIAIIYEFLYIFNESSENSLKNSHAEYGFNMSTNNIHKNHNAMQRKIIFLNRIEYHSLSSFQE